MELQCNRFNDLKIVIEKMSHSEFELKETKSIIRGLIISSVAALSIRQLENEYYKQEGVALPFKNFGYPSAEAFLLSIPDTVHLREPSRGCPSSMVIVEPVQSAKCEHVEKMVTRQKHTKPIFGKKRSSAVPESKTQKRTGAESSTLNRMAPRFIPLSIRTSLARVLQRYAPRGLPLESLGAELTCDLSMAGWAEGGKSGWLNTNGFRDVQEVIDGLKDQGLIKITTRKGKNWVLSSVEETVQHKVFEEVGSQKNQKSSESVVVPTASPVYSDDDGAWSDDAVGYLVSEKMRQNFREILSNYPDGLWCAALPNEYKVLTGSDLDVKDLGFISIVQMASKLKDVFICIRPDKNSDWLLFDSKSNSVWNSSVAPIGKGNEMPSLPSKFIRSIENLLLDHPNGIERAKFLEAYKAKYKEDFPLIDFGFENLMALLGHLAKRNVVHLKFSGYTPIVCMPFCFSSQDDMFVGLRKDDDFINALYPMDVVKYNEVIPLQELPEDLAPGYSFDIQVAEVESPSLFWFQIWEKNLQEEFEAMMDEMQVFYNGNGPSVHKMPEAIIMIGQYCAAKYPSASAPDAEWHRAIISSLPSLHEAEVYYIDYGSKLKLQYSEIYFLDSRFSKLPCQAHRGCLTNIRPIGYGLWKKLKHMPESNDICTVKPTWTKTCFYYFLSLVSNKPMVATVTHIRKLDNFLSMGLTDTNEEEDRHINDLLVTAKLAEFGVMSEEDEFPCFSPHRHESEHSSPGGSSSPMPLQRPIMAGNGYDKSSHYSTSSLKPSSSSASPATSACADNENGGSGVTSIPTISNGEEHLRDQSLTRAQREEEQLRLQALQEKLEGTILLEEAKRLEQEKKMEEVRKKLEIHQQCVELKKLEEVRWLEDQRQLDEQRRLEEQRWLEEQRRLKEQRLLEEQRQLEEQRWLGECRWLEEQRQLEKQRWLEEQRLLNEKKQMEEKAKQEAQLRFELQKLLIQEKLLSIQKQQFQAQLLFLSAQNSMSAIMPIGINSLLGSQPTLQPEMLNMMTKVNPPPGLPQLMAGGMPNNSLPSGGINPFQNLASLGNFSFQNQSIPLWNEVGNNLGGFLTSDFGGSGDNIAPKHTLYVPPGFKHLDNVTTPSQVPSAAKTPLSSNPGLVSNGIAISESGKLVVRPDSKLDNTEEPMTTDDNCSNKDPSRTAKFNSLPQVFGVGSSEAGSLEVSVNISKSSDSHPRKSEDVVNPVDGPGTVLSQSKKGRDGDEPSYISEPVVINPWSVQNSFVSSHVPQPKNYSPECSSIKGKSSGKAISPKALGVLNSLLESCKVHDKHTPSVAKEDASQKYLQAGERKVECDAQEKWKITIETPNSEDDSMDFMKGCLNGRAVNVIDVKGTKCVLTEEIMTLFFKNLPVHVALKIAELRPNGHKIKSLTINPLKERTLCQKISRLKIIEINPKGSDIYFTTVETLHYLCSALDGPK